MTHLPRAAHVVESKKTSRNKFSPVSRFFSEQEARKPICTFLRKVLGRGEGSGGAFPVSDVGSKLLKLAGVELLVAPGLPVG